MISCTFEDGGKAQLRHVVVDNLVLKDNKLLMVKRAKGVPAEGKWGLVGGFMALDESMEQAARREIYEETGYRLNNIKLLAVVDNPHRHPQDGERQNVAFVFVCEAGEKEGKADWESTEQKWFDFTNLPKEEEIAFDHYKMIQIYLQNKNKNLPQPIFKSE
ncbi:MAG: hypothetical protein A2798_00015 [Candidatus Levybacteria bacterium RIFCSPHIGHO2_01_FULL_37_17]|nr:MAG: hypothetical protein A2798_00015 [Candidatus Levybacteria bacterium RIFCSPHIGHO2_01_FULL_37_17]OGH36520.1 MAG: hypothetical protein A2959_03350 [Candidatus Levybacteria bacterium RIFCSPLOWO2_01_FULL_38_23]